MAGVRLLSCGSDWALERRCMATTQTVYYPEGYDKYETFTAPLLRQHTVIDFCAYDKGSEEPRNTVEDILTFNFCGFTSTCARVSDKQVANDRDVFVERFVSRAMPGTPSEMLIIQKQDRYAHVDMHMECPAAVEIKNIGVFACGAGAVASVNTLLNPNGERRSNIVLYTNVYMSFYKPVGPQATYELFRTMCYEKDRNPRFAQLFELDVATVNTLWPVAYTPMTKRIDNFMRLSVYVERNPLSRTIVSMLPYEQSFWDDDRTETDTEKMQF